MSLQLSLTGNTQSLRNQRADRVSKQIELHQRELCQKLELRVLGLQSEIDELTDTGPEHTTSLKVVPANFNPGEFVTRLHSLKVALRMAEIELSIANATSQELFTSTATVSTDENV